METQPNQHWAKDPEAIDRYIRRLISPQDLRDFESHLDFCDDCKSLVRKEQEIAAGIRLYGREHLKERLRIRVEGKRTPNIAWTSVVSAAAVLLIVVGFGVYNRWLLVKEKPIVEEMGKPPKGQSDTVLGESPHVDNQTRAKSLSRTQREDAKQPAGPPEEKKADSRRREEPRSLLSEQAEAPSLSAQSGAGVVSRPTGKMERGELMESEDEERQSEFWVEGLILDDSRRDATTKTFQAQPEQKARMKEGIEADAAVQQTKVRDERIEIKQRSAAELPDERKAQQKQSKVPLVQTLVQEKDDGLRMILYLDAPLSEKDLSRANVQRISRDSVVVEVPGQRIGYRLPDQWKLGKEKKHLRR